jgi:phage terminase small subunit
VGGAGVAKPARLKLLNGRGPGKDSAGRPVNEGPKFVRDAPNRRPGWTGRPRPSGAVACPSWPGSSC